MKTKIRTRTASGKLTPYGHARLYQRALKKVLPLVQRKDWAGAYESLLSLAPQVKQTHIYFMRHWRFSVEFCKQKMLRAESGEDEE